VTTLTDVAQAGRSPAGGRPAVRPRRLPRAAALGPAFVAAIAYVDPATEADLARIDEVVPAEGAHGARYPEPALRLIDTGEARHID